MTTNRQYELVNRKLTLKVKKAPLFARALMFLFAFLSFLLPITGTVLGLMMGNSVHLGYFIGIFVFGILGFYMLRTALWNTYGKEVIAFNGTNVTYYADYGWFKDGEKKSDLIGDIEFGISPIGYEEDKEGTLIIGLSEPTISCVTKMKIVELEELIIVLTAKHESSRALNV